MSAEITNAELVEWERLIGLVTAPGNYMRVSVEEAARLVAEVRKQKEMNKHLIGALDHCLRFSTLKRNWPEQYKAFVELLGEARKVTGQWNG